MSHILGPCFTTAVWPVCSGLLNLATSWDLLRSEPSLSKQQLVERTAGSTRASHRVTGVSFYKQIHSTPDSLVFSLGPRLILFALYAF